MKYTGIVLQSQFVDQLDQIFIIILYYSSAQEISHRSCCIYLQNLSKIFPCLLLPSWPKPPLSFGCVIPIFQLVLFRFNVTINTLLNLSNFQQQILFLAYIPQMVMDACGSIGLCWTFWALLCLWYSWTWASHSFILVLGKKEQHVACWSHGRWQ